MQEVLPKQAPDAAETNGKRDDVEKREKENKTRQRKTKKQTKAKNNNKKNPPQAELCNKTIQ